MKRIWLGSFLALGCLLAQEEGMDDKQPMEKEGIKVLEVMRQTKTGLIAGVELGIGGGIGKGEMVEQRVGPNPPISLFSKLDAFDVAGKLFVGYQKYFGKNEYLGFNVKAKAGIGYLSIKHEGQAVRVGNDGGAVRDMGLSAAYIPYSIGAEANFLYDFWRKGEQTLGMSLGVGYDLVYGVNTTMTFNNRFAPGAFGSHVGTYTDKNIVYSVISPRLGLHYYMGRHQFAGVFSLEKALGTSQNVNFVFDKNPVKDTLMTDLNLLFAFNLSYAYRF